MHTPETKNQFIVLRAQGWSIARIAEHLHVSKPTLIKWNDEHHCVIRSLRALELETLHESILASHKKEIDRLISQQEAIAAELANRELSDVPTDKLFALDALLRSQIQKARAAALPLQQRPDSIPSPENPLTRLGLANTPGFAHVEPVPAAFLPEPETTASSVEPPDKTLQPDSGKETVNKM
jgi:plasmid maintenance system antidote protein VapI